MKHQSKRSRGANSRLTDKQIRNRQEAEFSPIKKQPLAWRMAMSPQMTQQQNATPPGSMRALPVGQSVKERPEFDEMFRGQIKTPIAEVFACEKFPGNRRTEERVKKAGFRDNLGGTWGPEHCRDFLICTLSNYDIYHTGNPDNPVIEGQPGQQYLLNGNCRMEAVAQGMVDELPSHVWVEYVVVSSFDEMQKLYDSIDSAIAHETSSDTLGSMFPQMRFVPESSKYNECSFATAQNLLAVLTDPVLWGKRGSKTPNPLPGEHPLNARNRVKKEQFVVYVKEHNFNDMQNAHHEQLSKVARALCHFDAVTQAASMIKFRADGQHITRVHQQYLDAIFDPSTFTAHAIDSPIQYLIAEAMGPQQRQHHDQYVEFPYRGKFSHKLGSLPAVKKTLYWLERMEEYGQIDMKRNQFSRTNLSLNTSGKNGTIDLDNWYKNYMNDHKVEFKIDVDDYDYPIYGGNK